MCRLIDKNNKPNYCWHFCFSFFKISFNRKTSWMRTKNMHACISMPIDGQIRGHSIAIHLLGGEGVCFFFITHSCTESDSFLISFTIWQFYCFCFDGNLFISINHIHIHILILSKVLNWQEIIGLWLTFTLNCMRFLFRISRGRAHRFGLHFDIPFWIKASICYCNGNNNSTMVLQ